MPNQQLRRSSRLAVQPPELVASGEVSEGEALDVFDQGDMGLGARAKMWIRKNTIIVPNPLHVAVVKNEDIPSQAETYAAYKSRKFSFVPARNGRVLHNMRMASPVFMVNEGDFPNVAMAQVQGRLVWVALEVIAPKEPLRAYYGPLYDPHRTWPAPKH